MKLSYFLTTLATELLHVVTAKQAIVNGIEVAPYQYPFIVSLQQIPKYHSLGDGDPPPANMSKEHAHACGGTLINRQQFLTAAHCFEEGDDVASEQRVLVGSHHNAESGAWFNVSAIHAHPDYAQSLAFNDIALVTLSEPVDATIPLAKLPRASESSKAGSEVTLVGWGVMDLESSSPGEKLPRSPVLRHARNTIVTLEACNELNDGDLLNATTQGCNDGHRGTAGFGDSGGPAMQGGDTVVGIISYGVGDNDEYLVTTFVGGYLPWIGGLKPQAGH